MLKTAVNTAESVNGISQGTVAFILTGKNDERITIHCKVLVTRKETNEVLLEEEVL